MKFRLSAPAAGSQTESASSASPPSRQADKLRGAGATTKPVPTTADAVFRTGRLSGGDVPESSSRTGRPVLKINAEGANKDASSDLAFQVPETPPRNSGLGRHLLDTAKGFSLEGSDDVDGKTVGKSEVPFPLVEEDEARHIVCQDSLIPWTYLLSIPGKNVRDILIDAFNDWLKCAPSNLAVIKQVIGYLHTGSLIIDDIEDESLTRRGQPAAHVMFGIARSLNAGNYVYFLALEKVLTLQSTECVMVYTNEMLNLHRGQGRDIYWRTKGYVATEEEYAHMVCDKTGGLFRMAIRFMQLLSSQPDSIGMPAIASAVSSKQLQSRSAASSSFASVDVDTGVAYRLTSPSTYTATSDFTALANQLALYFQIRDDLINIASPKFHLMKGFCEDITEGKLSFMALHALRVYQKQGKTKQFDELLQILNSKTEDRKTIKRALTLMDDVGAFDHTVKYLKQLYSDIEQSIASLGKNSKLSKLLEMIASEVEDCHDVRGRIINAN